MRYLVLAGLLLGACGAPTPAVGPKMAKYEAEAQQKADKLEADLAKDCTAGKAQFCKGNQRRTLEKFKAERDDHARRVQMEVEAICSEKPWTKGC